jgi:hypothetical protein
VSKYVDDVEQSTTMKKPKARASIMENMSTVTVHTEVASRLINAHSSNFYIDNLRAEDQALVMDAQVNDVNGQDCDVSAAAIHNDNGAAEVDQMAKEGESQDIEETEDNAAIHNDNEAAEVDQVAMESESEDNEETEDNAKKGVARNPTIKRPSAETRLHGVHFAYSTSFKRKRCRLIGCTRLTTNCCTNQKCAMHLCALPAKHTYKDTMVEQTPLSKRTVFRNLTPEMRTCFAIYHCMFRPSPIYE